MKKTLWIIVLVIVTFTVSAGHRVTVQGKVWADRIEWDRNYMMSLDVDRLLVGFREVAAVDTKGQQLYGGWENSDLRGHTMGHWMTAMAMFVAQSGDEVAAQRLSYVIHSLAECQEAIGTGFLSAWGEEVLDKVEDTGQGWAPYYTIHKILQGLIDVYAYTQNEEALKVAIKLGDYLASRAQYIIERNGHEGDQNWKEREGRNKLYSWEQTLEIQETGGYTEAMLNLYAITGNEHYLTTARLFHQMNKLSPASQGIDELDSSEDSNHNHVNTTIPQFIGAARDAQLTGNQQMWLAAENFWKMVAEHRSYSIGCTGHHEHWNLPADHIADELTGQAGETCCTYNFIKLSNLLFNMTQKVKYAEFVERSLCNHILSAIQPETANFMYFHTVKPGTIRTYGENRECFWCCLASGMENPMRYAESIYYEDEGNSRLYVNQFIGSTMEGVLKMESEFPADDKAVITMLCDTTLTLMIRKPTWSNNFRVKGVKWTETDGYVKVQREWKRGDKVRVSFPMNEWREFAQGSDEIFSVLRGPLVMAGITDPNEFEQKDVTLRDYFYHGLTERYDSNMGVPVYDKSYKCVPLYELGNYRFTVYWKAK